MDLLVNNIILLIGRRFSILQVNDSTFEPSVGLPGLISYLKDGVRNQTLPFVYKFS